MTPRHALPALGLMVLWLLSPGCIEKKSLEVDVIDDDDTDTVETFVELVEGTRTGGASSTSCRFTFQAELLPDDAEDVVLDGCSLVFELNAEVGNPSMVVSDPDGTTSEPDLPTLEAPTVALGDFLGAHVVDGTWQLEFGNLAPCSDIDAVSLELSGSYTLP